MSIKYKNYNRPMFEVKVEDSLLPLGTANRTGKKQVPIYIVIHEVSLGLGKSSNNYNMEYYENLIRKQGAEGRSIGYHFLVGDKIIKRFIPEDEATDHTGTLEGNSNSIGVERLICEGISYEHALHNQAKLIATLMIKWNISLDHVKTHKGMVWTYAPERENKKNCPSRMLAGQRGGEEQFRREIIKCFKHKWFFNEILDEKHIKIINSEFYDSCILDLVPSTKKR